MSTPEYNTLAEIVAQLEFCNFECQGGPLRNNAAFIALKERAAKEQTQCPDSPDRRHHFIPDESENWKDRGFEICPHCKYRRVAKSSTLRSCITRSPQTPRKVQCCERDHDYDGNCDRHPAR
jgi:hypothetical protein